MRKTMLTILAVFGLLTFGIVPAVAATATPVQAVTYDALATVINAPSGCAVATPGESYTIPVPDAIAYEINALGRYGYHSITGFALLGGGAYPGQILVANYTPGGRYALHQYDVFIPGYQGRSCTQWVHLVAQG